MSIIEDYTRKTPPKWKWLWIVALLAAAFAIMKLVEYSGQRYEQNQQQKEVQK